MATIENNYTGNNSTTLYSFTFPYLETSDIKVSLDNVITTAYTIPTPTQISFNSAPGTGVAIRIYRDTDIDSLRAEFFSGSAIRAQDLNEDFNQTLYNTQETEDAVAKKMSTTGTSTMTGNLNMGTGTAIVLEGATANAHETTLTVTDPTADRTITLPNVTGTVITTGDTGTVATAMIADDAVTTAKIAAGAITNTEIADGTITNTDLANGSVSTAKIHADGLATAALADDAVTAAKIADDAVTTDKIGNGAVATAKIADDGVTAAKMADNAVVESVIAAGAVTTTRIAADAIGSGQIADDAVDSEHIADDAIDSNHYAADSIDTEHYAPLSIDETAIGAGVVTTTKIADATITGAKIAADTITATQIGANAIGQSELADSSVDTAAIISGAVATGSIADDAVTSAKIADNAVVTSCINAQAVTTTRIANDAIGSGQIADDAIDSEHYTDGSIDTAHIGDGQVTTAKIADDGVTAAKIADNAVVTSCINAQAVTTSRIANDAIGSGQIADDAINSEHYVDGSIDTAHIADLNVTTGKIAADAITGAKIADEAINSEHYVDGSIDTAHIADLNVTTGKIAADAITGAKIADEAIDSEHYTDGSIDTAHLADDAVTSAKIADDAVVQAAIADEAVNEVRLQISNAGSNGQYLQKQSGNTGGLTWASPGGGTASAITIADESSDTTCFPLFSTDATGDIAPKSDSQLTYNSSSGALGATTFVGNVDAGDGDFDGTLEADAITVDGTALNEYIADTVGGMVTGNTETGITVTYEDGDNTLDFVLAADSVSGANIADDAVDSEHYTDGSIDHAHLANDCVDGDNIADNSVGLAHMAGGTDGQIITYDASGDPVAVGPGTDGQVLTSTGAGSPPAFEDASSGGVKNIIINGAMQVAQRGTSSTTAGYGSLDRFQGASGGGEEACTHSQHALTSGDTGPWAEGFRNSFHLQNGNQTGGAGAGDYAYIAYGVEAQDLANSGWDYTSASSNITFSFWVKSSVAGVQYVYLYCPDGTAQGYSFATAALVANTWTKVTHTIPGDSDLTFNDDNGAGMYIYWGPYWGTTYTDSGNTLNTWDDYDSSSRTPDFPNSTWWTTNDATFEITGVQLEVGGAATNFEFKSYADELRKCQRYYEGVIMGTGTAILRTWTNQSNVTNTEYFYKVEKRASPTFSLEGDGTWHPGGDSGMSAYPSTSVCLFQRNDETGQFLTDTNGHLCCSFSSEL